MDYIQEIEQLKVGVLTPRRQWALLTADLLRHLNNNYSGAAVYMCERRFTGAFHQCLELLWFCRDLLSVLTWLPARIGSEPGSSFPSNIEQYHYFLNLLISKLTTLSRVIPLPLLCDYIACLSLTLSTLHST